MVQGRTAARAIAGLCFGLINTAHAVPPKWVLLGGESSHRIPYIDVANIRRRAVDVEVWVQFDFDTANQTAPNGENFKSVVHLYSVRCDHRTIAIQTSVYYSENKATGNVVTSMDVGNAIAQSYHIVPGSIDEAVAGWVCPDK